MNRSLIPAVVGVALLTCAGSTRAIAAIGAGRDTIPPALAPIGTAHANLRASFNYLLRQATAPAATRAERLALVTFLRNTLLPHAQNEELVLYPALENVLGTRGYATATMILDHRTIASRTLELVSMVDTDPAVFQQKAVVVAALIDHHFESEEQFVLPNLARRMSERELRALLQQMED